MILNLVDVQNDLLLV